jgi:hypothetical protein
MLPQSLHLPLFPAALSLTRMPRPHFGQSNLMVMARDPLGFAFEFGVANAETQHGRQLWKNQEILPRLEHINCRRRVDAAANAAVPFQNSARGTVRQRPFEANGDFSKNPFFFSIRNAKSTRV